MHNVTSDKTIVGVGSTAGSPAVPEHRAADRRQRDLAAGQRRTQHHHPQPAHHRRHRRPHQRADVLAPRLDRPQRTVQWATTVRSTSSAGRTGSPCVVNHFHDHDKTTLVGTTTERGPGHRPAAREVHHNYFNRSRPAQPARAVLAVVHVYNNYYFENSYGIASTNESGCWSRATTSSASQPGRSSSPVRSAGWWSATTSSSSATPDRDPGTVTEPSTFYSYTVDNPAAVPSIVPAGAASARSILRWLP